MHQFLVVLLSGTQTYVYADGLYEAMKAAQRKFGAVLTVQFLGG